MAHRPRREPAAPRDLDGLVERAGRATAARTSRRGFLAGLAKVGLVVAGGPALLPALAGPAHARVCGQSGVAPLCPTYDCTATWGWCWYASGCCANGALKKICDCCAPDTPHPRGYCPSGTRVRCIVESCGTDPRLQTVDLTRIAVDHPTAISVAAARHRFGGGVPIAVIGDAESEPFAALAVSAGRVADGPVLLTPRSGLHDEVARVVRDLGVEHAVVAGPALSAQVGADLDELGLHTVHVAGAGDVAEAAAELSAWNRSLTGTRSAVVVLDDAHEEALGPAAAFAHGRRLPLLLGDGAATRAALDDPRATRTTFVVTGDGERAAEFPGGRALHGTTPAQSAVAIAATARATGVPAARLALAPSGGVTQQVAAAALAVPLLLHAGDQVGSATFDWLLEVRDRVDGVAVVGSGETFGQDARWELQAVLNRYEAHLLTGGAGEGLPVIPQPVDERPIGAIPP